MIIILTSDYHAEEKEEDGILMTEEDFKEAYDAGGATGEGKLLECLEVSPLGRLMRFSNVR